MASSKRRKAFSLITNNMITRFFPWFPFCETRLQPTSNGGTRQWFTQRSAPMKFRSFWNFNANTKQLFNLSDNRTDKVVDKWWIFPWPISAYFLSTDCSKKHALNDNWSIIERYLNMYVNRYKIFDDNKIRFYSKTYFYRKKNLQEIFRSIYIYISIRANVQPMIRIIFLHVSRTPIVLLLLSQNAILRWRKQGEQVCTNRLKRGQ